MSYLRDSCNKELHSYLEKHCLPSIFESIFTALTVNQPADGALFMLEKLQLLKNNPQLLETLQWDTFIDEDKKPLNQAKHISLEWSDEKHIPSIDMLEKAYSFYNTKLLKFAFRTLHLNWILSLKQKATLKKKQAIAAEFHCNSLLKYYLKFWKKWVMNANDIKVKFLVILDRLFSESLKRCVFKRWHKMAVESIKAKEYFKRIEKGERANAKIIKICKDDHISLLPKQVAINIFRFVDLIDLVNCSKVCRQWKEITQASILWSWIDLSNTDHSLVSSKAVTSLLQKCRPFLCHLNMRACQFLLPKALKAVGDCRNLQDLNISQCINVNDDVVKEITLGCLSLFYFNVSRTDISDASLRYLSRNCNNIQYLNFSYCVNITDRGLYYLSSGKGSQKITYLDMSGCDQVSKIGFKHLAKGCIRLNSILLNELPSLTDECVESITSECKNLREISLIHSPNITDASIENFSASKKIKVLKLEGNDRLTDKSIKMLTTQSTELHNLYFVDVQRTTDLSLKALGRCKHLAVLNMADCVRLSDSGVRYIIEGQSGTKLREINFTNCIRVSDVSLLRMSQRCRSLAYANFSYCELITDAGVELLGTIPTLISLDLSGCSIGDPGVAALGNNPRFKDLIFSECCLITDIGIQKMVSNLKELDTLDLSHDNLLTDQVLKSVAFHCRRLRILNICGCSLVTDQGLQYLAGVCMFLEKLDISGCKFITDRSLKYLHKGCENITTLTMLYCAGISKYGAVKMQNKVKGRVIHSEEHTRMYLGNRSLR